MKWHDDSNTSNDSVGIRMSTELEGKFRNYAEYLKVLAHPVRLAIIDALREGTCCVNDVSELLRIPQPNVSQHLAILRKEGIVDYTEDGKRRCYFLCTPDSIKPLFSFLESSL
jgi:ArsR family transcriptional regulator, arsenate/arsenite/antimonite-responsive transcriptional repressor